MSKPPGGSRGGKSKIGVPHIGSEIFALGTKSSGSSRDDKSKVSHKQNSERKRDASSSSQLGSVAKKPKLGKLN